MPKPTCNNIPTFDVWAAKEVLIIQPVVGLKMIVSSCATFCLIYRHANDHKMTISCTQMHELIVGKRNKPPFPICGLKEAVVYVG